MISIEEEGITDEALSRDLGADGIIIMTTVTTMVMMMMMIVSLFIYGILTLGHFIRKIPLFPPSDEKVKLREVKQLIQCHTAMKCQLLDLNQNVPDVKPMP